MSAVTNLPAEMAVREQEPLNAETPFEQLASALTPNQLFYIRNHFRIPRLDRERFELTLGGAVRRPITLRYRDLLTMPAVSRRITLECAGNSRDFLEPRVDGVQWHLGAVGSAEWSGVSLRTLLKEAGAKRDACEIIFEAADRGTPQEKPVPPGEIRYTRSIPLAKADNVLLAYAMNGAELPVEHGAPLRAIVAGYYGMASVKWLTGIRLVTEPFRGYWQTIDYAYWDLSGGQPVRRALREMHLKSEIANPRAGEVIAANSFYEIVGAAWSGESTVEGVEVSTDDGASWAQAEFIDRTEPFLWRRWRYPWKVPEWRGRLVLRSRATDRQGQTQPDHHDPYYGSYAVAHTLPVAIQVR